MAKKTFTLIAAAALIAAGVAFFVLRQDGNDNVNGGEGVNVAETKVRERKSLSKSKSERGREKRTKQTAAEEDAADPVDEPSEFSPKEQKLVDSIQDALDVEDFKRVAAASKEAVKSTNAVVRTKAVEALRWFGDKSLPELTLFLADDDDDVRTTAVDAWTAGVSQMDAGEEKAVTVSLGLSVVTDKDLLQALVMQVDDLPNAMKIAALTKVIEGSNKIAAEVAREHYKFWTEEDYVDADTARKWVAGQDADKEE